MDSVPKILGFRTGLMALDPETLSIRDVLGSVNISKIMAQEVRKEMKGEAGIEVVSLMAVTGPSGVLIEGKNMAMQVAA